MVTIAMNAVINQKAKMRIHGFFTRTKISHPGRRCPRFMFDGGSQKREK
jgi:hypothetical protein